MTDAKRDIASWWAAHPQTYGREHGSTDFGDEATGIELGSKEFFQRADATFLEWNRPLQSGPDPFGKIFPYARYRGREVLEIGCGMGCMAMLWAERGANVTAVDLNDVAIAQTRQRFRLFGLDARIQPEDARALSFPDDSFDFVYSNGVLHHSPDLEQSVAELRRVLKPGGEYVVMLYNRHSLLHGYQIRYLEGFLHGESRFLDPLRLASRYTDGERQEGNPHTWPVTRREARALFGPWSSTLDMTTTSRDPDPIVMLMSIGIHRLLPRACRDAIARRWGWSLWISGRKAQKIV